MQNKETNNRRGISAQTQNMSTTNKCRRVDSPAKWQQKFGSGKQKQTDNVAKNNYPKNITATGPVNYPGWGNPSRWKDSAISGIAVSVNGSRQRFVEMSVPSI